MHILLFTGFALFISSCQKENINPGSQTHGLLSSSQEQQNSQKQQKKTVPFKAKFETLEESFILHRTELQEPVREPILANLPLWHGYFDNFPLVTGTPTITAANGDQIFTTFSGSVVVPMKMVIFLVTNNNIITGGTGRFAGRPVAL